MNPYKVCCLTYGSLHDLALRAVRAFDDPEVSIQCIAARFQNALNKRVQEALAQGTEVFVAASSNYQILRESYDVPLIGIEVGYQDYLTHILDISAQHKSIGIVSYAGMYSPDFSQIQSLLGVSIRSISYSQDEELKDKIAESGCTAILGGGWAVEAAESLGLTGRLIYPSIEVIESAFRRAKNLADSLRREKHKMMYYAAVIGESPNGIISIDHQGIITNYNPSAERYLGVTADVAKGKPVDELFPQLEMTKTFQQKNRVEDAVVLHQNRQLHLRKILMAEAEEGDRDVAATALITDLSDFRRSEISYLTKQRILHTRSGFVAKYRFSDIIGTCKPLLDTIEKAKIIAKSEYNVFICGETGTGKELLAQGICHYSDRGEQTFVAVNCAALPDSLLESELFGYKEGAFTGSAKGGHRGLFELANGGTIFLDEISSVSPALQVKLLRVLQEREIMRIGDDKIIPVDVRIISATNQDPEDMLRSGFRLDLLYRLNELELELPPLRERGDDVLLLFHSFLRSAPGGVQADELLAGEDLSILRTYSWPGNIQELRNVCARFSIFCQANQGKKVEVSKMLRDAIGERRLLSDILKRYQWHPGDKTVPPAMLRALDHALGYTKDQIAALLGISRTTLWRHEKQE